MAPSTIIDKLRNLRPFIEYLSTQSSHNIGKKCDLTMKWLQKRAKTLLKEVKRQQMSPPWLTMQLIPMIFGQTMK